jgi:tetratricopeptide (TPR) repeat protein
VAPLVTAVALVVLVAAFLVVNRAKARQRWLIGLPWIAWGLAWFLAQAALLTQVYPLWGPFRATSGAWGLGIALVATTWAAAPALLTALVALRLLALVLSAGAPALVHEAGESAFDYASLARLSRFTHETREALTTARPTLPAHGTVAWRHRPLMAQHAFAQGQALQVWYRDTTLRWISWEDVQRDFAQSPDVVLEFEPDQSRQIVVLDSAAVNAYQVGDRALSAEAYELALLQLGRADSLQGDRQARVFLAAIAGKRALCQLALGEAETARREAEQSLASWRDGSDARYVLAVMAISEGRLEEARRQLDSLLARYPYDVSGRAMLDTVRARERAR